MFFFKKIIFTVKKVNIVLLFAIITQVIMPWQLYTMKYRKQGSFLWTVHSCCQKLPIDNYL